MQIDKRDRSELKSYFVKNAIPTESNFAELIDAMLNQKDDGIVKLSGDPLSLQAERDDTSKKVINLYQDLATDTGPSWVISLNADGKAGFDISDGSGQPRLFINQNTGNVGIGTRTPNAKLEVSGDLLVTGTQDFGRQTRQMVNLWDTNYGIGVQNSTQYYRTDKNFAWYKGGSHNHNELHPGGGTAQMVIKDGQVGIGKPNPADKLDVDGNIRLSGAMYCGNSDLYFTKTNHNHTGTGNTSGHAAIENAASHGALMILGRAGTDKGRYVRLWDYLQVNGSMDVTGSLGIGGSPDHKLDVHGSTRVDLLTFKGVGADSGVPGQSYAIYQESGPWNHPYPNLVIGYHTGIKIGGHRSYEGIRFYNDAPGRAGAAEIMSVGKTDNNVRVNHTLIVSGNIEAQGGITQESWHTVAANELQNRWVNYGGGYNGAAYFKDSLGIVHLKGLVRNGVMRSAIFTLPAGYRPPGRELHGTSTDPNVAGRIDVLNNGQVLPTAGSARWISLDGITFRAGTRTIAKKKTSVKKTAKKKATKKSTTKKTTTKKKVS